MSPRPTSVHAAEPQPAGGLVRPLVRPLVGALIAVALLFPAAALSEGAIPAVEASNRSCTGWQSIERPPDTIRVYRNSTGKVQEVNFKRYVQVVMASEWPNYLPTAAIEAGAVAVKQYGWSKTLVGRHRRGYVTASGQCYDVTDGTRDQLFKPEKRTPGTKILAAVDKTWRISLRKDGRFFQTGYRRGSNVACGSDADGWRLYARSVTKCANNGLSRQEIQFRYYGRDLSIHTADGTMTARSGSGSKQGDEADKQAQATPKPKAEPTPKPKAEPTPKPKAEPKQNTRQAAPKSNPTPRPTRQPAPRPTPPPEPNEDALLEAIADGDTAALPQPGPVPTLGAWLFDWPWAPGELPADWEDWDGESPLAWASWTPAQPPAEWDGEWPPAWNGEWPPEWSGEWPPAIDPETADAAPTRMIYTVGPGQMVWMPYGVLELWRLAEPEGRMRVNGLGQALAAAGVSVRM